MGRDNNMHPNVRQKETIGAFAAAAWLLSGIFLIGTSETASFWTWQAAAYFIAGVFIAAVLFGVIFYWFESRTAKSLAALVDGHSQNAGNPVFLVALVLVAVETVVVFLVASWVVNGLLF